MWPFKPKILQETVADLKSGEEIIAKANYKKPPNSILEWTFHISGNPFALISATDSQSLPSIPLSEGFRISDAKHTATTTIVELRTFHGNHHGSVMHEWLINFNIETMTASVKHCEYIDVDS